MSNGNNGKQGNLGKGTQGIESAQLGVFQQIHTMDSDVSNMLDCELDLLLSADAWEVKGNDAKARDDFKEAIDCYSKAIKLDPTNHVYFSNRSATYLAKYDTMKALADAEKCIQLNPSWAKGYSRKGAALFELGRFDSSISAYKQGLVLEPDCADLKNALVFAETGAETFDNPSPGILFTTACIGELRSLNALLRLRAGVNEYVRVDSESKEVYSALGGAIKSGQEGAVKLLLLRGADANLDQCSEGEPVTPIEMATDLGLAGIVKLLIYEGEASVNLHLNDDQWTLLHRAADKGFTKVARVLLDAGAHLDARTVRGWAPITVAVTKGHAGVVQLLIQAGASVHGDYFGRRKSTLLHAAAEFGHAEVARVLLAAGARLDARTTGGRTALEIATTEGQPDVAAVLRRAARAGGGVNAPDKTPTTHTGGAVVVRSGGEAGSGAGASSGAGAGGVALKDGGEKKKKKKKKKKAVKDENRPCDGPGCSSISVNRCKACKRPAYCGVECQRAHWNGGHKEECKMWRKEEEM